MNKLLDQINNILYKDFFLELINSFNKEYPTGNTELFINNIPQSGIVEQYDWLIHKIRPVIYSGLNHAEITNISEKTSLEILKYIRDNYPVYYTWRIVL